jgi:hypothetical protein
MRHSINSRGNETQGDESNFVSRLSIYVNTVMVPAFIIWLAIILLTRACTKLYKTLREGRSVILTCLREKQ